MSEPGTPLMAAVCRGSVADVRRCLLVSQENMAAWVDSPDPRMWVTPLMMCAFRDEPDGVAIATMLMDAGAHADTPDGTAAQARPLFMAAQQGNAALVKLLAERGAALDATGRGSTTTAVWIAAQNGHAPCVAQLLEAAQLRGQTYLMDATSKQGKSPALIAVELAHPAVLGVLARCGADLRGAAPPFYGLRDTTAERVDHFDPSPSSQPHFALDAATRSFASQTCCNCGGPATSRCAKCSLAYFCGRECQLASWPSHKRVCSQLKRGRELVSPSVPLPSEPPVEAFGFAEDFGAVDEVYDGHPSNYDRDAHPVWEYDGGVRGRSEWRRYPARIEAALESMCTGVLEGPKFMYRPAHPDNDGMYEAHNRSRDPPPSVATRFVIFDDMTEREVYTGAWRAVRRDGLRRRPE